MERAYLFRDTLASVWTPPPNRRENGFRCKRVPLLGAKGSLQLKYYGHPIPTGIFMIIELLPLLSFLLRHSGALRCYSCSFSFNEPYDTEHKDAWCANESLVIYDADQTSKICASWEPYCVTSITTVQDAFTEVTRGCGEKCSEYCESEGFGFDQVQCDDCCEEDLCNSNFSVQYYRDTFSRQKTSWVGPLPEELKWNNDSGMRFMFGSNSAVCLKQWEVIKWLLVVVMAR
ncbi:unnamed protein product, partial [Mesorhabditis spiculigera]